MSLAAGNKGNTPGVDFAVGGAGAGWDGDRWRGRCGLSGDVWFDGELCVERHCFVWRVELYFFGFGEPWEYAECESGAVGGDGGGSCGCAGASGIAGSDWSAGIDWASGAAGPAGPTGATGAAGAAGKPGLVYQGNYSSVTNYALGDVVFSQGASYASLIASNHGNTPDQSPGQWGVLTAQGPAGPTGAQGPQGSAGVQGPPGSVGPPGETGPQGAQGIPGQAGAQGLTGPAGAQGLQGPMGPQGPAGPVGMTFRGAYSSTVNYGLADGVLFNGAAYVSLVASNHGNTPDVSPAEWSLFATGSQGASGTGGARLGRRDRRERRVCRELRVLRGRRDRLGLRVRRWRTLQGTTLRRRTMGCMMRSAFWGRPGCLWLRGMWGMLRIRVRRSGLCWRRRGRLGRRGLRGPLVLRGHRGLRERWGLQDRLGLRLASWGPGSLGVLITSGMWLGSAGQVTWRSQRMWEESRM